MFVCLFVCLFVCFLLFFFSSSRRGGSLQEDGEREKREVGETQGEVVKDKREKGDGGIEKVCFSLRSRLKEESHQASGGDGQDEHSGERDPGTSSKGVRSGVQEDGSLAGGAGGEALVLSQVNSVAGGLDDGVEVGTGGIVEDSGLRAALVLEGHGGGVEGGDGDVAQLLEGEDPKRSGGAEGLGSPGDLEVGGRVAWSHVVVDGGRPDWTHEEGAGQARPAKERFRRTVDGRVEEHRLVVELLLGDLAGLAELELLRDELDPNGGDTDRPAGADIGPAQLSGQRNLAELRGREREETAGEEEE